MRAIAYLRLRWSWITLLGLFLVATGRAQTAAPAAEGIPPAYAATAALYDIPPALLYAMALVESGRRVDTAEAFQPWPWTLNVAGEGYYYPSKTEAWTALQAFVLAGRTNIGIGLLQVTYPYNAHILTDVYAALDPHTNLSMGAAILRERFEESRDWSTAVGRYHSPGSTAERRARAERYRERVRRHCRRLAGDQALCEGDRLP